MDAGRKHYGVITMSKDSTTLLALLLPPVAYDTQQPLIDAELTAEGNAFNAAYLLSESILKAVTPIYSTSLLADWERVLGIGSNTDMTYQQRLENVLVKIAETGGLSIPYFQKLASRLGYSIDIIEPTAFHVGINRCGDRLMVEDTMWTWGVVISGLKVKPYYFRTGSSAVGERLSVFADAVIESIFNDLKPAHTFCYFIYQDS